MYKEDNGRYLEVQWYTGYHAAVSTVKFEYIGTQCTMVKRKIRITKEERNAM